MSRCIGSHGGHTWVDEGALCYARDHLDVRSVLDIGCGPGGQVRLARDMGIDAFGLDGDPSVNPDFLVDFTKDFFDIGQDFDLGWSVEFLEHVPEQFIRNYMPVFQRCKYVLCTAAYNPARNGEHSNAQHVGYWISLFEHHGFAYSPGMYSGALRRSTMQPYDRRSRNHITFLQERGMAFENLAFEESERVVFGPC